MKTVNIKNPVQVQINHSGDLHKVTVGDREIGYIHNPEVNEYYPMTLKKEIILGSEDITEPKPVQLGQAIAAVLNYQVDQLQTQVDFVNRQLKMGNDETMVEKWSLHNKGTTLQLTFHPTHLSYSDTLKERVLKTDSFWLCQEALKSVLEFMIQRNNDVDRVFLNRIDYLPLRTNTKDCLHNNKLLMVETNSGHFQVNDGFEKQVIKLPFITSNLPDLEVMEFLNDILDSSKPTQVNPEITYTCKGKTMKLVFYPDHKTYMDTITFAANNNMTWLGKEALSKVLNFLIQNQNTNDVTFLTEIQDAILRTNTVLGDGMHASLMLKFISGVRQLVEGMEYKANKLFFILSNMDDHYVITFIDELQEVIRINQSGVSV